MGKGSVSEEHLVEFRQDVSNTGNSVHGTNKPMDTTNAKTHHDFVNPIYPASTKARNHYENDMWQSPVIGRDTPGVLGGRSTSAWVGDKPPSMDNDSAFQEPDLASSYEGDEDVPPLSRYLSFSSVSSKDKRKLLVPFLSSSLNLSIDRCTIMSSYISSGNHVCL